MQQHGKPSPSKPSNRPSVTRLDESITQVVTSTIDKANEPLYYLAAPYSSPSPEQGDQAIISARREEQVRDTMLRLLRDGLVVYSPISHSAGIADAMHTLRWYAHGLRMLRACTDIIVLQLPGWEESVGVSLERAAAEKWGKTIHYLAAGATFSPDDD